MTLEEARGRVEGIRAIAGDDESAHSAEDKFREDVLRYIAARAFDQRARELAAIALATSEIEFARWCA